MLDFSTQGKGKPGNLIKGNVGYEQWYVDLLFYLLSFKNLNKNK